MQAITIDFRHFDTELGTWRQAVWRPPALSHVVSAIWYLEGKLTHPRERLFPPGSAEIVVRLRGGLSSVAAEPDDRFVGAEVMGQITRAILIDAPDERSAVLGIRLHPAGAYGVFGHPIHELTGGSVDLADLTAEATEQLAERCASASSVEGLMRVAAAWVERRASRPERPSAAVTWALARLTEAHGTIRIASLQSQCGMSRSRFTTAFREQVGVAPKVFARITRFRRALGLVRSGERALTDIALASGYYDQAHFTSEFRRISGFTPGEFPASRFFPASDSYMAEPGTFFQDRAGRAP
jgi:AraC-like DNA-binding protein